MEFDRHLRTIRIRKRYTEKQIFRTLQYRSCNFCCCVKKVLFNKKYSVAISTCWLQMLTLNIEYISCIVDMYSHELALNIELQY
jgi:glutaredoxin